MLNPLNVGERPARTAKRIGMAGAMKRFLKAWDAWDSDDNFGKVQESVEVLRAAYKSFDERFPEER